MQVSGVRMLGANTLPIHILVYEIVKIVTCLHVKSGYCLSANVDDIKKKKGPLKQWRHLPSTNTIVIRTCIIYAYCIIGIYNTHIFMHKVQIFTFIKLNYEHECIDVYTVQTYILWGYFSIYIRILKK